MDSEGWGEPVFCSDDVVRKWTGTRYVVGDGS